MTGALIESGLPAHSVQLVPIQDRGAVDSLLTRDEFIDLVIPRGGETLIRRVTEQSRIPVIQHYKGICHIYIDRDADAEMAIELSVNAKTQRPGVCNAVETILFHKSRTEEIFPRLAKILKQKGVEIRADAGCRKWDEETKALQEGDYGTEFLGLIVAVGEVDNLEAAIDHIDRFGSNHTATIVTENEKAGLQFQSSIDASCVLWNASTRFNDGGKLGLGAEMGISTTKLHAYGPMGAEALTTLKFLVKGTGQIRED